MHGIKESGIAWVGTIPDNWDIEIGKNFMRCLDRPVAPDDGVITCFRDGEVTLRSKRRTEGFTISFQEFGYQGIEIGDLVVHGMDGFAGAIGISDSRGKATPVLCVLDTNQNKKYMMYALRNMAYTDVFLALSTGIRVRTCDTSWKKIRSLPFVLPSMEVQAKIADTIDKYLSQIKALIANQESEIEKLKAYKQSLINEAVTKGLDPNVLTKDSRVEWVKTIPNNWDMVYPKALFAQRKDRALPTDEQLTASQQYGIMNQKEYMQLTGTRVVVVEKDFSILKHVSKGDFVISMRSFQGGLEYSEVEGCISSAYVMLKPNSEKVFPKYYRWLLKSSLYINSLQSTSDLIRDGQAMRFANFIKIWLPCPPLEEQKQIASYLDEVCPKIDSLIAIKQSKIEKLNQYKKSLIYEYVTGKKEVM